MVLAKDVWISFGRVILGFVISKGPFVGLF